MRYVLFAQKYYARANLSIWNLTCVLFYDKLASLKMGDNPTCGMILTGILTYFLSSPMHIFHSFITEATSSVKQEMCGNKVLYSTAQRKCNVLCHLVPFVEFRKRKKHPWRSATFSKFCRLKPVTLLQHSFMDVFHIFKIIQIVPNGAERLEYFPKTRSTSCF